MAIQAVVQVTTRFAVEDFFPTSVLMQEQVKNYYQRASYEEEKIPMICDTSAALEVQGTNSDKPNVA